MNDKDEIFQTGPYKATKNLNTIIGNPDININSVVTSNIMESPSENTINNQNNNVIQPEPQQSNDKLNNTIMSNNNQTNNPNQDIISNNINQFVNSNQQSINNTFPKDNETVENKNQKTEPQKASSVKYENVYQSKKIPKKKSFKIPSEFKTTLVVALILLIFISFFEKIYDFLRNLNIFG